MRAGIITFHYAYNYGAVVQCYALQEVLKTFGCDVKVISYYPRRKEPLPLHRGWGIREYGIVNSIRRKILQALHSRRNRLKFDAFRSTHIDATNRCYSKSDVAKVADSFDLIITGSDQVWHFDRDTTYFLEWGTPYEGTRVSYAACCGSDEQSLEGVLRVAPWLRKFTYLSVRDSFSQKWVEKASNRKPFIVADPVLLTELTPLDAIRKVPYNKYILVYIIGSEIRGGHETAIRGIKERVGDIPVISLMPSVNMPKYIPKADYKFWDASPNEWLYLLKHASYVLTDSFHGALLSAKYKRNFCAYYTETHRAHRLLDMAKRYKLDLSVVGDVSEAKNKNFGLSLPKDSSQHLISEHRKLSLNYISAFLGVDIVITQ